MSEEKKSIAGRLRLAREQAGLSQGQVALKLGLHRPTVSEIEAGRRRVTSDEVAQFASLYKVSVTWLLRPAGEKPDPKRDKAELAARALMKLKEQDLDLVLDLLGSLRNGGKGRE
jgi:transcriptional regulator with XRE-family HTH domain